MRNLILLSDVRNMQMQSIYSIDFTKFQFAVNEIYVQRSEYHKIVGN